jgi:phage terminase large subunit GpA-like protein
VIENATARAIDVDPGPILIVQPRKEDAVDFVEERIEPMIRDTPQLRAKVYKASKKLKKLFRGGILAITSAGAPENAGRRAVMLLCFDEVDRYRLTREGNFIPLVRKRLATYKSRGKEICASSPTFEGSEIDKAYQASDQREFHVPCPLCSARAVDDEEVPHAGAVGLDRSRRSKSRRFPRATTASTATSRGMKTCAARRRARALDREEAVPRRGGFWISELYSYSRRLDQIVLDFLEKKDNPEDLRGFVNTSLAENFADQGDTPDWQALVNRREKYAIERACRKARWC